MLHSFVVVGTTSQHKTVHPFFRISIDLHFDEKGSRSGSLEEVQMLTAMPDRPGKRSSTANSVSRHIRLHTRVVSKIPDRRQRRPRRQSTTTNNDTLNVRIELYIKTGNGIGLVSSYRLSIIRTRFHNAATVLLGLTRPLTHPPRFCLYCSIPW
jgi:hypothetical protein